MDDVPSVSGSGPDPRPWGYVSARVIDLARGERCDLAASAGLVLLSGSARLSLPDMAGEVISAFPDAVVLDRPLGDGWVLTALAHSRLVLFSET